MRFTDKVVLITGAGAGIGRATAIMFSKEGAKVAVNSLTKKNGDKTLTLVREYSKGIYVQGDVSLSADAENIVKRTLDEFGRLDILVNNAGITLDNLILRMSLEDFRKVIDINLTGAFICSKYAVRHIVKNRSGKIINISSTSALGNVGQINYSASKAGVIGMTKTAAKELGAKGVNVNAIAPGMIWTDMMKSMPPETLKQMDMMLPYIVPMNRKGSPLDIANLALFLASDESSFITGQIIFCDGGMKM